VDRDILGAEAFISTFTRVATYWTIEAFEISDLFGSAEDVAVFGSFTYLSVSLGQAVRSPFSIHATVKDGKIAFFQFMEDTFATAPVPPYERGMGNPDATRRTDFRGDERAPSSRQGSPGTSRAARECDRLCQQGEARRGSKPA